MSATPGTGGVAGGLQHAIRGHVFAPGQPGFEQASHVFNPRFDRFLPQALARPIDAQDVRDAIRYTTSHGVAVRARSGGHSYAGYSTSDSGAVLDLRRLNMISVNKAAGTATIGAGAQLIDINAALAGAGATLPGGSCPSVGISGVTLGGGFGLESRAFGLTCDNLLDAEIVTADGQLREISQHSDPDLLWALKGGGGGNFGVVTRFTFRIHPIPSHATYFQVNWPWASADDAIGAWQSWAPHALDAVTSILHVNSGPHNSIEANGQYLGPKGNVPGLLHSLLGVPGAQLVANSEHPFLELQLLLAGCAGHSVGWCHTVGSSPEGQKPRETFVAKSDYVKQPLDGPGRAAMIAAAESPGSGALLCDAYGGAINRINPTASAFMHREPLFCIQYYGNGSDPAWVNQAWTKMRPHVSGHAYQNYVDHSLPNWQDAYYGQNLARLKATRERVDPHHYFDFPQAIGR